MSLFNSSSNIEKELEEFYVSMFTAMTAMEETQVKKLIRDLIKQSKEEQKQEGTDNLPEKFGDYLLEEEKTDEKIKNLFAQKRKEGVRDEDIKWWHNMYDLERRMLIKTDDFYRLAMFKKFKEDGKSGEEAALEIRKYHPMYGDPNDNKHLSGDDRPLPYELKDRINRIAEKDNFDPNKFKIDSLKSSSFNAFIRKMIKKGNL